MRKIARALALIACLIGFLDAGVTWSKEGDSSSTPPSQEARVSGGSQRYWVEEIISGLHFPSSMAWLPNGDMLITERLEGTLRIARNGKLDPKVIDGIPPSFRMRLNGFRDIVIDPDYSKNQRLYLLISEGTLRQYYAAVYSARFTPAGLVDVKRIFRSKDDYSNGGAAPNRLLFLADKTLLVGIAENGSQKPKAQQLSSHMGKILRINRDGSVPPDNPFVNNTGALPEIWSYGHREVLGLFQDAESGEIWGVESGPRGGDELNLIESAANYGWAKASWGFAYNNGGLVAPLQSATGMVDPLLVWTPSVTPSSLVRYRGRVYPSWNGDFFIGHLTAKRLERLRIENRRVVLQEHMLLDIGERIRDVKVGPDNHLYILTDHQNGRVLRLQPGRPSARQQERVARKLNLRYDLNSHDNLPGNPVLGQQSFIENCAHCHSVGNVVSGGEIGPDLANVIGRKIGSKGDFAYSAAMAASTKIWDATALKQFVADPSGYLPRNAMEIPPLTDPGMIRNIVSFLEQPPTKPWTHMNLVAWEVAPYDPAYGPEERAALLARLDFKNFSYDWHEKDVPDFDAEIAAHRRHGINVLGWWFPLDIGHPASQASFAAIERNSIAPQLWVPHEHFYPSKEDWAKYWPKGSKVPREREFLKLSNSDREHYWVMRRRWYGEHPNLKFPKNVQEQEERVRKEADRIDAIAKRAKFAGSSVALYNHGGWFGIMENQLAIIEELAGRGVTNVGMVYFFAHSRDEFHDDSKKFDELWPKIKAHVYAVSVAGISSAGQFALPSQGEAELEMLRIIHESGWRGPIVLSADFGAEDTLRKYRTGLDWLVAEIASPGAGGPRPFPRL